MKITKKSEAYLDILYQIIDAEKSEKNSLFPRKSCLKYIKIRLIPDCAQNEQWRAKLSEFDKRK